MSIPRLLAVGALLAIGAALVSVPACVVANDFENGQDCLKDEECSSKQCTAGKCVGPNGTGGKVLDSGTSPVDSGAPTDGTPGDATDAASDGGVDGAGDAGSDTTDGGTDAGSDAADGAASD